VKKINDNIIRNKGVMMMLFHAKRRKKNQEDQRRRMIIKMMSSFAVTAVVAVAVVFAPTPPVAEFIEVSAFGNQIYYETYVQDVDSTISEGSLKIVIASQLKTVEQSLSLGEDSGVIFDLDPGIVYDVSIKAKSGYGEATLAKTSIATQLGYGGRIADIVLANTSVDQWGYRLLTYEINTVVNDSYQEISAIRLKYATIYASEYQDVMNMGETLQLEYTTVDIFDEVAYTLIENLYDRNMMVFLVLEADLISGETVILHERTFTTPIAIDGSIYVHDATPSTILATIYTDYSMVENIAFQVSLIKNGSVIKTITLVDTASENEWSSTEIVFDNLTEATLYHIRLEATFLNPDTQQIETQEVRQIDIETAPMYTSTVTFDNFGTSMEIALQLTDPQAIFTNIRCVIFEVNEFGEEVILSTSELYVESMREGQYLGTILIATPGVMTYTIRILAEKTYNNYYFYSTILGESDGSE
jgi:hypothetical protein